MFFIIIIFLCSLYYFILNVGFRYLTATALEEHLAGKDTVDDIKKAVLDVCLNLTCFYM